MSFTGNEIQNITLNEGAALTKKYRDAHPIAVKGHYFSQKIINEILSQEDCVGIRVYYGLTEEGGKELVIVGVTTNEDDLYEGVIADRSIQCPPACPVASPLNS